MRHRRRKLVKALGMGIDRRTFMLGASGAAAAQGGAASALRRSGGGGSIMDVEHVVVLMQENR